MILNVKKNTRFEWEKRLSNTRIQHNGLNKHLLESFKSAAYIHLGEQNISKLQQSIAAGPGYVILTGLPQDKDIPSPPVTGERAACHLMMSEMILLGITEALGFHPFSYKEEKNGALVHEITPLSGKEQSISSNGTTAFPWHTDAAYLNRSIRPQTLSLYCLTDTQCTGTSLASIDAISQLLTRKDKDTLLKRNFLHTAPETFSVKKDHYYASVLDLIDGSYELKLSSHNICPLTIDASHALNTLTAAMDYVAITHQWAPGDMIIFNNFRCVHARGHIKGERWLQRCYGSTTINPGTILQADDYILR